MMKKKLFLLNPYIWVLLIMGFTAQSQNPFCEDFNQYGTTPAVGTGCDATCHPSLLNNWGGFNIDDIYYSNTSSQGGAGDHYLRLKDGQCNNGGTYVYNDTDFNGNWLAMVPQEEGCFCFDMRAFHIQIGTVTGYNTLRIYNGPDVCSSTISARFNISTPIDVALGWQRVCAPIALSNGGVLPGNSDGQWVVNTGNAADWDALIANVNSISFYVDVDDGTESWGIDNICISELCDSTIGVGQPTDDGAFCCNDEKSNNLVTNGNFELGDTDFFSDYSQSTATYPGEYNITNSAAAFGANITDQSYCADPITYWTNDLFMVVNGKTQQSGFNSTVWEQSIQGLEKGKEYKFCANFKDMEQCTFNILPTVKVSAANYSVTRIIDTDDTDPCDWQRIEICFTPQSPNISLKIELVETGNGDGNDLAIDDISLQEKVDPDYFLTVQHQGDTNEITGSLNTISNTDDELFNEECDNNMWDDYYWFVYEPTDPNNPNFPLGSNVVPGTFAWANDTGFGGISTSTWDLTTTFPSYPFAQNTFYVIGMWVPSCCESCYTESWEFQITYNYRSTNNNITFTSETKEDIKDRFIKGNYENMDGNKSLKTNDELRIFPNPTQDNFNIELLDTTIQKVEITSISGQKVFSKEVKGNKNEVINVSSLSSGMYFVSVEGENQKMYSAKLIKE